MTTTTISPAGQLTEAAIARRDEAQAQGAKARRQAQAARSAAAALQGRLHAGDFSVSVADIVNAGPAADRLEAIADLHDSTLPGFEAAIREARTNEVLERVSGGEILTYEAHAAKIADLAQQIADFAEPFELALEPVAERHLVNAASLTHTTAYGNGFTYRHGNPYSPIHIGPGEMSFDVDGTTYLMAPRVSSMIDNALKEAERELSARRKARASAQ